MDTRGPESDSDRSLPSVSDANLERRTPTLADRVDDALVALDELRHRRWFVASGLAVALVCGLLAWRPWLRPTQGPIEDLIPQVSLSVTTAPRAVADVILVVHVVGEVADPGVYVLAGEHRIEDAIEAAGGPTLQADLHALNLAAPLADGSQIRVPAVGDPPVPALVTEPNGSTTTGPINLNTASARELEGLPGVGPSTSAAIIDYRESNGPFLTLDDLLDVPGIGPAKLAGFGEEAVVG